MSDGGGMGSGPGRARLPEIHGRTRQFAIGIIRLYAALPKSTVAHVIGRQLLRSGTSVGAHCREAHRSRSTAEFVSKLELALQELEETAYWLEILTEARLGATEKVGVLAKEADELTAIIVTCVKRVKQGYTKTASRK
jgi:four helix bundle protein